MHCTSCGRPMSPGEQFCTGCGGNTGNSTMMGSPMGGGMHDPNGMNPNPMMSPQPQRQSNGLAIGGFICALIGLLIFPLEIIGLILSIFGLVRANKLNGAGRGLAIAGIVISIIGIVILIIAIADGGFFIWD